MRFSGPGPYVTPDIDDPGFMSISVKLMGVPGPKLMEQEKHTQDLVAVSPPTFVTPDIKANAQLQIESGKNAQIFYFLNFGRSHLLDLIMQGLWMKTQSSPFEAPYFSCAALSAWGRPGDAILGLAEIEEANADSRAFPSARLPTICAMPWWPLSTRTMSNSISACNSKPIRS